MLHTSFTSGRSVPRARGTRSHGLRHLGYPGPPAARLRRRQDSGGPLLYSTAGSLLHAATREPCPSTLRPYSTPLFKPLLYASLQAPTLRFYCFPLLEPNPSPSGAGGPTAANAARPRGGRASAEKRPHRRGGCVPTALALAGKSLSLSLSLSRSRSLSLSLSRSLSFSLSISRARRVRGARGQLSPWPSHGLAENPEP